MVNHLMNFSLFISHVKASTATLFHFLDNYPSTESKNALSTFLHTVFSSKIAPWWLGTHALISYILGLFPSNVSWILVELVKWFLKYEAVGFPVEKPKYRCDWVKICLYSEFWIAIYFLLLYFFSVWVSGNEALLSQTPRECTESRKVEE